MLLRRENCEGAFYNECIFGNSAVVTIVVVTVIAIASASASASASLPLYIVKPVRKTRMIFVEYWLRA